MPSAQDTLRQQQEFLRNIFGFGADRGQETFDPVRDMLLGFFGTGGMDPGQIDLLNQVQGWLGGLPQPVRGEMPGMDLARGIMSGGARSPETNQAMQMLLGLAGGNTAGQQATNEAMLEMLGLRGRNAQLSVLGDRAREMLANGGMTGDLQQGQNAALALLTGGGRSAGLNQLQSLLSGSLPGIQSLISKGGLTPELAGLLSQAQAGISGGGSNAALDRLMASAQGIIDAGGQGGALRSMEEIQGFARDAATRASRGQFEAAQRRALALGGGPGSRLSGSQFRSMAEFADQAANAEAAALREATLGQQGLQLQQLLGAFGAGNEAQRTAAARLGAFTGLAGDVARSGAGNLSAALGSQGDIFRGLLGVEQQAGQNLATGAGLFGDIQKTALGRLSEGARLGLGIENQVLQNLLGATGTLQKGAEINLDALKGLQGFAGLDATNLANAMQMFTSLSGQGVQQNADLMKMMLGGLGLSQDIFQSGRRGLLDASQILSGNARAGFDLGGGALGPMSNIANTLAQLQANPWWKQLLSTGLQAGIGAGMGGFGSLFGGGFKAGGGGGNWIDWMQNIK